MAFRRGVGVLGVVTPASMAAFFSLLASKNSYPRVMDLPAREVLTRLGRAEAAVTACWLGVMLSTVLFLALVVCLDRVVREETRSMPLLARRLPTLGLVTVFGVLATLFMMLDLGQWVFLYPDLGRRYVDPATTAAARADLELVWLVFHRYVGVGIGIYAATFFNALWALGAGWVLLGGRPRSPLPWLAVASGLLFMASIAPGIGFAGYGVLNSVGFVVWAIWLTAIGWRLARTGTIAAAPALEAFNTPVF